ncbi:MAG: RNA-binding S4 domain-containing protein [Firmicutes bacterium]|nr:RNA-binding S4 domain-containing protein [Bacillota bacterium]
MVTSQNSGRWPKEQHVYEVGVSSLPINLGEALKLSNSCQTGGEAKALIQRGLVQVNGNCILQRGRKLFDGDVVEVSGKEAFRIVAHTCV